MANYKRSIKIIHAPFQLKVIGVFATFTLVALVVTALTFNYQLQRADPLNQHSVESLMGELPGMLLRSKRGGCACFSAPMSRGRRKSNWN